MFDNPEVRFALVEQLVSAAARSRRRARDQHFRVSRRAARRQFIAADSARSRTTASSRPTLQARCCASAGHRRAARSSRRMRQQICSPSAREPIVARQHRRRAPSARALRDAARAAARGRGRRRSTPSRSSRTSRSTTPRSRRSTTQNPAAFQTPEQAKFEYVVLTQDALARAGHGRRRRRCKAQYDSAARSSTRAGGAAAGGAHPHRGQARRAATPRRRRRRRRRTSSPRRRRPIPRSSPSSRSRIRRIPGSAPQGGDLGSIRARHDGEAVRRRGVRGEAGRDRRARCRPISASTSSRLNGVTPRAGAAVRRGQGADRNGPEAAEGRAEVRRRRRPVPEPRLRAGRFAGAGRKALDLKVETTPLVTRAQAQQLALGNAKFVQALFSPESIAGEAQHRGDRGRAQHADGGPHRRVQAGGAAPVRRGEGRDPPAARAQRRRPSSRRRPGARSSRCSSRARATRRPASRSASRSTLLRNQAAAGLHHRRADADLPGRPDEAAAPTSAPPNERGGFSIYKLVQGRSRRRTPMPAKLAAARARIGEHAEPRALRRLPRDAQGEGRRQDQPGQPREEVAESRRRRRRAGACRPLSCRSALAVLADPVVELAAAPPARAASLDRHALALLRRGVEHDLVGLRERDRLAPRPLALLAAHVARRRAPSSVLASSSARCCLALLELGFLGRQLLDGVRIGRRRRRVDRLGLDVARRRLIGVDDAAVRVGPLVQRRSAGADGEQRERDASAEAQAARATRARSAPNASGVAASSASLAASRMTLAR